MPAKIALWRSEYLVEVDVIDTQHRKFFKICEHIALLCTKGEDLAVRDLILRIFELRSYAFFHFHTEEDLMVKYGYPEIFRHLEEHDAYLDQLRSFGRELAGVCKGKAECDEGDELRTLALKINDHATTWYANHIMGYDKYAMDFIKKKKRA
jgi:hemerythrin